MYHLSCIAIVVVGTAWLLACCKGKDLGSAGDSGADGAADQVTEAVTEEVAAAPDWDIPDQEVPAAEGDVVFAVNPIGDSWDVVGWKVGDLKEVSGTHATFNAAFVSERPNTPGSVMVPVPEAPTLKKGDIVFGDVYATCRLARVEQIEGDKITTKTVWIDEPTEVVMTLGRDVAKAPVKMRPMSLVAYPEGDDDMYLGEVIAIAEGTVWVISPSGAVKQAERALVAPVNPFRKYKKGYEVYATWGGGKFYKAEITDVIDDGLQYEVDYLDDNPALEGKELKAFWEITRSIDPGEKFSRQRDDAAEDTTPEQTYGEGKPTRRGGRSEGGRSAVPVARPKKTE